MTSDRIAELEAILATAEGQRPQRIDTLNALALALRFQDRSARSPCASKPSSLLPNPAQTKAKPGRAGAKLLNLGTFLTQDGQFERSLNTLSKAQLAYEVLAPRAKRPRLGAIGRVYVYLSDYANAWSITCAPWRSPSRSARWRSGPSASTTSATCTSAPPNGAKRCSPAAEPGPG